MTAQGRARITCADPDGAKVPVFSPTLAGAGSWGVSKQLADGSTASYSVPFK